mmetsp:Transcript_8185/g.12505  ORF Transcript_8185/g.12505 Transcript_8185/m.12505 type:complete len:213 (+) Transcript_8185:13-651(+)
MLFNLKLLQKVGRGHEEESISDEDDWTDKDEAEISRHESNDKGKEERAIHSTQNDEEEKNKIKQKSVSEEEKKRIMEGARSAEEEEEEEEEEKKNEMIFDKALPSLQAVQREEIEEDLELLKLEVLSLRRRYAKEIEKRERIKRNGDGNKERVDELCLEFEALTKETSQALSALLECVVTNDEEENTIFVSKLHSEFSNSVLPSSIYISRSH